MTYSDVFGIRILNAADKPIYTWNKTYYVTANGVVTSDVSFGPVIKISTPATP
jgi:hypothetical protein